MLTYLLIGAHLLGILTSFNALMVTRTPQGTIAWIFSLYTVPLLAVPAYWILGRDRFHGYVIERRALAQSHDPLVLAVTAKLAAYRHRRSADQPLVGEQLATLPYLDGNTVELLINGDATFDSILAGIERAKESVLVQFYIVRADDLGRRLQARLIERAKAGVAVYFLYDEVGSSRLPSTYVRELEEAGVHVSAFHTTRGAGNRFQLNFRNHRKIVVVDANEGWVGGHNVGDEYLGKNPRFGHWRDTHMRIQGPAVVGLMVSFAEDWKWATDESLSTSLWDPTDVAAGEATVLVVPTGPADRLESASLMFQQAIQAAQKRIWIASPYFIPDQAVAHSLHLAAMRGVDVRIVIPNNPDQKIVYYSAFNFVGPLLESGVRVFRYLDGFLHQKVFLLDDETAGVGTANFDNRSFRLNFEVTAVTIDAQFAQSVEAMLEDDFATSREMTTADLDRLSFWFKVKVRAASLLAPIQ